MPADAQSLALREGIQSTEPRGGSDARRMENGGVLSHGVRGRFINRSGSRRRRVEDDEHPQRPPLIGPIGPSEAVETGKGTRPEQLKPEQGTRRPGTDRSRGD